MPYGYIRGSDSERLHEEVATVRVHTPRDVGNLVRDRRHDLRLTQQQLADRAGVSRPWLASVEAGHPRAELGKLLSLLAELELVLDLSVPQDAPAAQLPTVDLNAVLARHDHDHDQDQDPR